MHDDLKHFPVDRIFALSHNQGMDLARLTVSLDVEVLALDVMRERREASLLVGLACTGDLAARCATLDEIKRRRSAEALRAQRDADPTVLARLLDAAEGQ